MKIKRSTGLLVALLSAALLLGSCGGGESVTPSPEAETIAPLTQSQMGDYTQNAETAERVETLRTSFSELAETPAADFSTETANGAVTVLKYNGQDKQVRVPTMIEGVPVTAIAKDAFAWNTALESLYLPDSIKTLGESILVGCEGLTALRTAALGADAGSAQYLGYLFGATAHTDNARDVPDSLAYLELGGMETLPDYALFDCNDLEVVTLPESMHTLGKYSLYQCSSLLAINTERLTELKPHALDTCSALTVLHFDDGLQKIGLGALEGCTAIKRLTLPFVGESRSENTYLAYLFGATVPDFAEGYYPTFLAEVILSDSCEALGDYAFYRCTSLTRVKLSQGLTSIGLRAFYGCRRLAAIELPQGVKTIRENAFFGCISLASLEFGENATLTSLGVNAFYGCSALTRVKLPMTLETLPASAFADCYGLTEIDLGGVTAVGKNAFHRCTALTSVTMKERVEIEKGNEALKQTNN